MPVIWKKILSRNTILSILLMVIRTILCEQKKNNDFWWLQVKKWIRRIRLYVKNQICNILTNIFCLYFQFCNHTRILVSTKTKILSSKKLLHQRYGHQFMLVLYLKKKEQPKLVQLLISTSDLNKHCAVILVF